MESISTQIDYNYEEERKKLKLGPLATCILLFKTTVGVGIFTYQYAYAKVLSAHKCGFILGTLLSSLVFYMLIYGMHRLIELCDIIEAMEEEKKKATPPIPCAEVQVQVSCADVQEPKALGTEEGGNQTALTSEPKVEDIYEIEASTEKYQVVTFHRNRNLQKKFLIGTLES